MSGQRLSSGVQLPAFELGSMEITSDCPTFHVVWSGTEAV
jgi:hypothetical protein